MKWLHCISNMIPPAPSLCSKLTFALIYSTHLTLSYRVKSKVLDYYITVKDSRVSCPVSLHSSVMHFYDHIHWQTDTKLFSVMQPDANLKTTQWAELQRLFLIIHILSPKNHHFALWWCLPVCSQLTSHKSVFREILSTSPIILQNENTEIYNLWLYYN